MILVILLVLAAAICSLRNPSNAPGYMLGCALFFVSPSLLSIDYSFVGWVLMALAGALAMSLGSTFFPRHVIAFLFLYVSLHSVSLFVTLISQGHASDHSIVRLALAVATALSVIPVLSTSPYARAACLFFMHAVVASAGSFVVTRGLRMLGGVEPIEIGEITSTYGRPLPISFPLTPYLGVAEFLSDTPVDRWTGLAREPGMAALYCLIALAILLRSPSGKFRLAGSILLALGVLGTGSSTGTITFFVTGLLLLAYRGNVGRAESRRGSPTSLVFASVTVAAISVPIAQWALRDKAVRDEASLSGRISDTNEGIRALRESPFIGLDAEGESYSLIGGIAQWGIAYPILAIALLGAIAVASRYSVSVIIALMGALVTFLFTQPALGSSAALLILFALGKYVRGQADGTPATELAPSEPRPQTAPIGHTHRRCNE